MANSPSLGSAVRVGVVQFPATDDSDENRRRGLDGIARAAGAGAQLICLQELFASLYFCQSEDPAAFKLAESIPGPTTETVAEAARRYGVAVVVPVFERRAPGVFHNSTAVIDADGSLLGVYRKMHIPDDPSYYEKYFFTPGDTTPLPAEAPEATASQDGFGSFRTRWARVGPLICWDQWYPEAARIVTLLGAEILCYPTAIGWLPEERNDLGDAQREAWEVMHRAHAIANGVFVVAANRVGREGRIEFWGNSLVCDPFGRVLARGATDREEVLVVDCDLSLIERTRCDWPFLRDRRTDAYGGITSRFLDRGGRAR